MNTGPEPTSPPAARTAAALRQLPQLQRLLEHAPAVAMLDRYGRARVVQVLRLTLERLRGEIRTGQASDVPTPEMILSRAGATLAARAAPGLRRAINATGIVLHTNLGRAPLAPEAIEAMSGVAGGYANLEIDLATGKRGARDAPIEPLLREVTGAEAALAVNNGAAALLLALSALASGGTVIVSRGELVEIGGGFRIPDVIAQGGARLVEVGATNKTRASDYRDAIGPDTRVLLKVHQSNFRMVGFTEEVGVAELAALAQDHGLPLVVDLGSGLLRPDAGLSEPTVSDVLHAGADLVTFSGDKLMGGPQAGMIAGRGTVVAPLRRHPLMRALRLDKIAIAAIEATLRLHRDAPERVPVLAMLAQGTAALQDRAARLRDMLGQGEIARTEGFAGGGTLPGEGVESRALALRPRIGAEAASARLRLWRPAVVCRIAEGRLVADMLTVTDADLPDLAQALRAVLS